MDYCVNHIANNRCSNYTGTMVRIDLKSELRWSQRRPFNDPEATRLNEDSGKLELCKQISFVFIHYNFIELPVKLRITHPNLEL